jgi:hypothetical protein
VVNKKIFITFLLNEAISFFIAKPFFPSAKALTSSIKLAPFGRAVELLSC